jgi:hypothetical protein
MTKWKIQNHQPSEGILLYLILYFSGMLCVESEDRCARIRNRKEEDPRGWSTNLKALVGVNK